MHWNQKLSLSVQEIMAVTGWSHTGVYKKISNGELLTFRDGRRRMATPKAVEKCIANLERESAGRAA